MVVGRRLLLGTGIAVALVVSAFGSALLFNGLAHGEWSLAGAKAQPHVITKQNDDRVAGKTNLNDGISTPKPNTGKTLGDSQQPTPTASINTSSQTTNAAKPNPAVQGTAAAVVPTPMPIKYCFVSSAKNQTVGGMPTPSPTPWQPPYVIWSYQEVFQNLVEISFDNPMYLTLSPKTTGPTTVVNVGGKWWGQCPTNTPGIISSVSLGN